MMKHTWKLMRKTKPNCWYVHFFFTLLQMCFIVVTHMESKCAGSCCCSVVWDGDNFKSKRFLLIFAFMEFEEWIYSFPLPNMDSHNYLRIQPERFLRLFCSKLSVTVEMLGIVEVSVSLNTFGGRGYWLKSLFRRDSILADVNLISPSSSQLAVIVSHSSSNT